MDKIHNPPLKEWSLKGISVIASQIGRPLHADPMTNDRSRLGYARVCVEVNVLSKFPKYIDIDQGIDEAAEERRISRIPIKYQWIPSICSHCRVFGHSNSRCPKQPKHDLPKTSEKRGEEEGFVKVQSKKGKNKTKAEFESERVEGMIKKT